MCENREILYIWFHQKTKPMKNLIFFTLFLYSLINAQSYYKQISEKNINAERQVIAKNFIQDFLKKCENRNYTKFENYNLTKRLEMFLDEKLEKNCVNNDTELGKIDLLDFNSAYINKYSLRTDPYELFIFNVKTEKKSEMKFISVWIYQDRNYLSGILISQEKPLKPRKKED